MRLAIFRGGAAPWLVGLARAVVEAALMAVLIAIAGWLATSAPAVLIPYLPVMVGGIRILEGLVDQIDPAQKRTPNA